MIAADDPTQARLAREAFLEALVYDDPVQLYEKAPCGFVTTTADGVIVKCNATFRTWLGLDARDIVGTLALADLLAPGSRIFHDTHYAPSLLMHGSVREIAFDLLARDGRRLPVLVNATMERDERDRPTVVRVALFDATERRSYERELLRAKERAEEAEAQARALARTLQQTLVPPTPPQIPGLLVSAVYHPAGRGALVGGDFYDVFPLGGDDWIVLLGDICGKGVEAAVVAGLVRHSVRALAAETTQPAQLLANINGVLLRNGSDRFCTAVLARLRRRGDGFDVVLGNAGHPAPYVLREGQSCTPMTASGQLLGVFESGTFSESRVRLGAGDALLFYTDGVTEGRQQQEQYGNDRLREAIEAAGPHTDALVGSVLADVLAFQGGEARDDIAMIAVSVPASAPA